MVLPAAAVARTRTRPLVYMQLKPAAIDSSLAKIPVVGLVRLNGNVCTRGGRFRSRDVSFASFSEAEQVFLARTRRVHLGMRDTHSIRYIHTRDIH